MNVMSAGCHPARSPPTAGSWLGISPLHGRACRGTNQWPTCRSSRHLLRAPGWG